MSCVDEDEKNNWNPVATIKNQNMYEFTNLQSNKSYKVKSKYKNQNGWSKYSEIVSFTTKINKFALYQDLQCYGCSTNETGKMIICNNVSDPDRNDSYCRNGYSALCPAHENMIGTANYYKSRAT
eukprot:380103_1